MSSQQQLTNANPLHPQVNPTKLIAETHGIGCKFAVGIQSTYTTSAVHGLVYPSKHVYSRITTNISSK